ncbi:MAG: ABC transporter permease subunit [Vicinamibacterales bacterium]
MTSASIGRIRALLAKEWLDVRWGPSIWLPLALTLVACAVPTLVAVVLPGVTGESLADAEVGRVADAAARVWPELTSLGADAAAEAVVYAQFLALLVLVPVSASVAAAAYGVVGEKMDKTLEPLLATPLTTTELLTAKVVGAAAPACALSILGMVAYAASVLVFARPGVFAALMGARTIVFVTILGPLVTLVALQGTILASTRSVDPRSAQQAGSLAIVPVTAFMVAEFSGAWWLSTSEFLWVAAGLAVGWLGLLAASVALFDRERVLLRWK